MTNLIGLIIEATGLQAEVGELCHVRDRAPHASRFRPRSSGFRDARTLLMPLGEMHGIGPGTGVTATGQQLRVTVGEDLLGRVVDALGDPIDGLDEPIDGAQRSTTAMPPAGALAPARSATGCRSACARSTRSSRAAAASASASSPAPASASRRCWA